MLLFIILDFGTVKLEIGIVFCTLVLIKTVLMG